MAQNGQNDHFGQNDLIPNRIWYSRDQNGPIFGPFWPEGVHFGPFRSANVLWPFLVGLGLFSDEHMPPSSSNASLPPL